MVLKNSQNSQETACVGVSFLIKLRSSRSQMFFKVGVLKIFAKYTGKYLSRSLFLIKLQAIRPTPVMPAT